jgi:hypothetical protein
MRCPLAEMITWLTRATADLDIRHCGALPHRRARCRTLKYTVTRPPTEATYHLSRMTVPRITAMVCPISSQICVET